MIDVEKKKSSISHQTAVKLEFFHDCVVFPLEVNVIHPPCGHCGQMSQTEEGLLELADS